jgi:serine/threonine protein kinase
MEPTKFGRYEIKSELGRGGMATVYHAYDPRFEREVALKVLPREMLHDPQFRTRFEREAKTIAMLEHPVIVPVYDFGEEDGQPYFVMRYMTGGSLTDRMKQGPMSIQDAARLFDRLAPALDQAHAKGIIHRDLKPGNILFDQYGDPYVSDFGIAKITSGETNVTGSAIVGTPAYMSPEQAQGEKIDGRSDIYGLGVILYELLSGKQPYHGDTPMSVVVKHITDPVPHILDVKPDLPPAIETVIEKAMAKDRDQRYPTVRALADALNKVARETQTELESRDQTLVAADRTVVSRPVAKEKVVTPLPQAPAPTPAPMAKKTRLYIGLGGAAVVLILAVVGAILIFGNKTPATSAPSPTVPVIQGLNTPPVDVPSPTLPPATVAVPVGTDTLVPSPTIEPTATTVPLKTIGGADQIAFLSDNEIWVMGVDGGGLTQVTKDAALKDDLQWSPDGQSIYYISGKCIQNVAVDSGVVSQVTCFTSADYLEAFEISPDGTQVAISLNRVTYVVPFDLTALSTARTWVQLQNMNGCFTYGNQTNEAPTKSVRWSGDGKKLAIKTISVEGGKRVDLIRLFDISRCDSSSPYAIDNFPGDRFTMTGYSSNPVITSFAWDGQTLFVLNVNFRYELGYMAGYNTDTRKGEALDPMHTSCCYSEGRFSPDGSYLFFAYQNINAPATTQLQLYYVPYGTIGTGVTYTPIELPETLFVQLSDHLDAALRPVKP